MHSAFRALSKRYVEMHTYIHEHSHAFLHGQMRVCLCCLHGRFLGTFFCISLKLSLPWRCGSTQYSPLCGQSLGCQSRCASKS